MEKDVKAFLKIGRHKSLYRPVRERINDFKEVFVMRDDEKTRDQSSRCMDCGTPFCHWACPVGNFIPEWNDLVRAKQWERAFELLNSANNLPEITARVCPNLCEYSCVLGINDEPVTIRENELGIIEYAFRNNLVRPDLPQKRTGKKIAVVGSGPAGLSCADQLNKAGHKVTVFERDDKPGGILRYGIPDFKLEKWIIDRRIDLYKKAGIEFKTRINVGVDYPVTGLKTEFDAVCLTAGCRVPRDFKIEGRELPGIHFAMDYLIQSNKKVAGVVIPEDKLIDAAGKKVVIIGGGDTGADCLGIAHRQKAKCVVQVELMPKPSEGRTAEYSWPKYPLVLKTSTSHEEGGMRQWSVLTKKFMGEADRVKKLSCVQVEFIEGRQKGCAVMKEITGSEFEIEADLVILSMGFLQPEHNGLLSGLDVEFDNRGNVQTNDSFMTSQKGIFAAGDMRRGQSLIIWAISEGRKAAHHIDKYLMGNTRLAIR